jgi:hypothetical protein
MTILDKGFQPIILVCILSLFVMFACQERNSIEMPSEVATLEKPANSPSEKYVLVVKTQEINGNKMQSFQILDKNHTVVYTSSDNFLTRDVNFFLWDSDDRVWVYSGDLGTFYWENQGTPTLWKKYVYAENNVSAPPFLKEVRPRWHQK